MLRTSPAIRVVVVAVLLGATSVGCSNREEPGKFVRKHRHVFRFGHRRLWDVRSTLLLVGRDMKRAHDRTGRYPRLWSEVGDDMAVTHSTSVPTPSRASWFVDELQHRLVIEHADASSYLIRAYDVENRVTWEMDECHYPRQQRPMRCDCHLGGLERKRKEPGSFLRQAQYFFMKYWNAHEHYPRSWADTREIAWHPHGPVVLHWFSDDERHLENDPRGLAPPDATDWWQPYGSDFTYVISDVSSGSDRSPHNYRIQSYNHRGLTNYFITAASPKPRLVVAEP